MTPSSFGHLTPETLAPFADRYELTMLQGYLDQDHTPEAAFSLFFRDLPANRGHVVAAGLEQALAAVELLSFGERARAYLADEGFDDDFLAALADVSVSGEIRAVPEGTVVFPNEPLLEVRAPLPEAQLLETRFLNQVGVQSLVATKAARMRDVVECESDGQTLVDFGARRAHGTDAGLKAARAAYLAGFDGTSLLAAGEAFGVPTYGTMAHSWVQSFPPEHETLVGHGEYLGEKRVGRVEDEKGYVRDVLGRRGESGPGQDLLRPVVVDGERVSDPPTLDEVRSRARENVRALPPAVRAIDDPATYEVAVSEALAAETERLRTRLEAREG